MHIRINVLSRYALETDRNHSPTRARAQTRRYALNYKQLPYTTTWVEYPSIASTVQSIGAGPTSTWPSGEPMYTLPAIVDPKSSPPRTALAGSLPIVLYLDRAYPDTPRLIPEGTAPLQAAFEAAFIKAVTPHMQMLIMPVGRERLHDASKEYYRKARESEWGGKMGEWAPAGSEARARHWEGLEKAMGVVKGWLEVDGQERKFFMGDAPTFADMVVGARLMWMKTVLGEDSDEWKTVEKWHGGRWAQLLDDLQPYADVKV